MYEHNTIHLFSNKLFNSFLPTSPQEKIFLINIYVCVYVSVCMCVCVYEQGYDLVFSLLNYWDISSGMGRVERKNNYHPSLH